MLHIVGDHKRLAEAVNLKLDKNQLEHIVLNWTDKDANYMLLQQNYIDKLFCRTLVSSKIFIDVC